MPHTYADLLAILDTIDPFVDPQANGQPPAGILPTAAPSPATPAAESEDDPHRLARVNLERYATRNDGRTLAFWRDEWFVWKRNAYRKISKDELRAKLSQSIKEEFDRVCREKQVEADAQPAHDSDEKPIVSQKVTCHLVSNVIGATSGMVNVSGDTEPNTWLPAKERRTYISMKNGILDIDALLADRDDFLLSNSPKWFSMVSLPYDFIPEAQCPRWQEFLEYNLELDPERIKFMQEWAGYLLTPSTDEQAFLILEGEGKNGKSVYIAGLNAMLGVENVSHVALESFGERFELTQTIGRLLNAVDDCGDLDKVAEGRLKTFVSGAAMFFDRKGVEGYSKVPTARLMVACNTRPRFSDRSDAIWRRMKVIPWRLAVPEEKRIKGMDKVTWWQKTGELPGIFWWALQGLARLRAQDGFSRCQLMEESLQEYKEEMNPARVFLQENLEFNKSGLINATELYKLYKKWIDENGYRPLSGRTFGKEVKRVFPNSERAQRGSRENRCWCYQYIQYSQEEICGTRVSEIQLF